MNYPERTGKKRTDNSKGKTPNRDVNATNRVQVALELKAAGLTLEEIAVQAGYGSRGAAHNAIKRELDRNVSPKVEEMRSSELEMLKILHRKVWEIFDDATVWPQWKLKAADTILAISERKSKLYGLDVRPDDFIAGVTIIREYGVEVGQV